MKVAINKIKPDPKQPRKTFEAIDELAESIKAEGMLYPLLVDKNYNLIDGERRLRAIKKLGLKKVEVIVLGVGIDDKKKRLILQLVADIHNEELDINERDQAYLRLWKKMSMPTQRVLAIAVKKSEEIVGDALERARFVPKMSVPPNKVKAETITETRGIEDDKLRNRVIAKASQIGGSRTKRQYIERVKKAIDSGNVEEVLKEDITDFTKIGDRVIYAIKIILKELNKGLMLKIPPTQAVILSGSIVELQRHLKTWDSEDAELA